MDAKKWLKANGANLAPLTGQDTSALYAIDHCWDLYARGDGAGQFAAMSAVVALLSGMQPKCWPLARQLIAKAMDWADIERLWPLVEANYRLSREGLDCRTSAVPCCNAVGSFDADGEGECECVCHA